MPRIALNTAGDNHNPMDQIMTRACHPSRIVTVYFLLLVLASTAYAQRRQPVASDDEQWDLIEEGRTMHDNQEFDSAIARYNQVLALNPHSIDAIFELTASHYDKGDYKQSLDAARRGTEYESEHLSYFYLMLGTNHDLLKQPQKAVEAYKAGLAIEPGNYLLEYNLAVTYLNLKRPDEARECFKRAIIINPNHTSSHIGLGQLYVQQGDRMPALLALGRATILEPETGRSEIAIALINGLLVPAEGRTKEKGREGGFATLEPVLASGGGFDGAWTGDPAQVVSRLNYILEHLQKTDAAGLGTGFAAQYYAPYFRELAGRGFAETFAYYAQQSRGGELITSWLMSNEQRVQQFLQWSKGYKWE